MLLLIPMGSSAIVSAGCYRWSFYIVVSDVGVNAKYACVLFLAHEHMLQKIFIRPPSLSYESFQHSISGPSIWGF